MLESQLKKIKSVEFSNFLNVDTSHFVVHSRPCIKSEEKMKVCRFDKKLLESTVIV